jgi:predicted SprT family Zn-dependent metalloprotease
VTKVEMQTPMIAFDNDQFQTLAAGLVEQRPNREQLHAAMSHEPYQAVLAELEALGGVVEQPAGTAHDLTAAFDRVNDHYFQARLSRPRLTWSDTFTGRKFGHYDPVHDTVMVSVTLDHAEVPALAVDFVIYHELLHRELGIEWHNGRARPHDRQFQESEQQFEQFQQAKQVLAACCRSRVAGTDRIARRVGLGDGRD